MVRGSFFSLVRVQFIHHSLDWLSTDLDGVSVKESHSCYFFSGTIFAHDHRHSAYRHSARKFLMCFKVTNYDICCYNFVEFVNLTTVFYLIKI